MVHWRLEEDGLFLKDFGHQGSVEKLWTQRWQFPVGNALLDYRDNAKAKLV